MERKDDNAHKVSDLMVEVEASRQQLDEKVWQGRCPTLQ